MLNGNYAIKLYLPTHFNAYNKIFMIETKKSPRSVAIFEMATGKPPNGDKAPISALHHIGNGSEMPTLPSDGFSDEAVSLVGNCLQLLVWCF